jgi:hypothetical protein
MAGIAIAEKFARPPNRSPFGKVIQLRTSLLLLQGTFHIDHNENKLSIWRASLPEALAEFLSKRATYRITISIMGSKCF